MKLFTLQADLELNASNFNTGVMRASEKIALLKKDMSDMGDESERTQRRMDIALGNAIGEFIGKMAGAMTDAVFEWTTDGIMLASSLEETNSKINTIFGDNADAIHKWAKTTRESYGIGELTAKNYAAQVAGILSSDSKNLAAEEIQNISTSLVELAGDLASFHNMSFDDVFGKLMSGLRGETEAIEALGVDLRASNLAAAFDMTTKEWGALDQRTRLLNTYQYIMQETAVAQGDFARTSDSYANQLRILDENINSLKLSLGETILPAMTELVSWFNSLFGSQENAAEGAEKLTQAYGENLVSIETTATNALALVEALEDLSETSEDAASTELWGAILSELEETLPGLSNLIDENTGSITGGTEALRQYIDQWRTTSKEIAQMKVMEDMFNMADTMEAEIAKLQMEQQIAEVRKTGAKSAMSDLGSQLLSYMVQGMSSMKASEADIKAMQQFGSEGASSLLARIAGGGNMNMIMSALLQGGDIWKNKSFMDYFVAGGGTTDLLSQMVRMYSEYESTYGKYDIDHDSEIAERNAILDSLLEEISIMEGILDKSEKERIEADTTRESEKLSAEDGVAEVDALVASVSALTNALTSMPAEVAAAAQEGCAAGVSGISITGHVSTGNVVLSNGLLVGTLAPQLNLALGKTRVAR